MFTPRSRGGNAARRTGERPSNTRVRGLFADGVWHCECTPRLPAQRFQVKKDSKNKGRWFYTCQKSEEKRCGFFLWEDEAKTREEAAVLANSRSEPLPNPTKLSPQTRFEPPRPQPVARKRSREESEDDEFGGDEFSKAELQVLSKAADTPHKAIKTSDFATPSKRRLPWLQDSEQTGLPTPDTTSRPIRQPLFTPVKPSAQPAAITPHTGSSSLYPDLSHQSSRTLSPTSTPTPLRFADIDPTTPDAPDLSTEVFALLKASHHTLSSETHTSLHQILTKHTLRTQGIVKGREISRLALKAKDAKIAELQSRIAALEAEFEAERAETQYRDWSAAASSAEQ